MSILLFILKRSCKWFAAGLYGTEMQERANKMKRG